MVRTMELDNLKKIQFELNAQNLRELAAGGGRRGVGADGLRQEVALVFCALSVRGGVALGLAVGGFASVFVGASAWL